LNSEIGSGPGIRTLNLGLTAASGPFTILIQYSRCAVQCLQLAPFCAGVATHRLTGSRQALGGQILPIGYNYLMTKSEVGLILASARRRAGKTQAELAKVMGTTQPVIARAEAGYRMPTLGFIDRWARATGAPISLRLGETRRGMETATARRATVRSVLGPGRFNPWDRNPSQIEAELLNQAGQSREHFERLKRDRGQRR
jgi:transcriptional regulator with XRE-family HTH domain